ncbi:MAG: hypothetical protein R3B48_11480 [Kofleriaceae bacterium]
MFSRPRSSTLLGGAVAAFLACWTGCAADDAPDLATEFNADHGPFEAAPSVGEAVAQITTADGATLSFINEGEPGAEPSIGVEIASSSPTPVTDALLAQDPSALELYQAVAPGRRAPQALLTDHERAASGRAPRQLVAAALDGETRSYYPCDDTTSWRNSFTAWAPVLDGQYIATNESGLTYGYVGYAPKFYFDVCRPFDIVAGLGAYYTGVQRRASSAGTWATINTMTGALNIQQRRWRYYHNTPTCSSYQYRLVVSSGSNRYHRAARWADEWSCQLSP